MEGKSGLPCPATQERGLQEAVSARKTLKLGRAGGARLLCAFFGGEPKRSQTRCPRVLPLPFCAGVSPLCHVLAQRLLPWGTVLMPEITGGCHGLHPCFWESCPGGHAAAGGDAAWAPPPHLSGSYPRKVPQEWCHFELSPACVRVRTARPSPALRWDWWGCSRGSALPAQALPQSGM